MWAVYVKGELKALFIDVMDAYEWAEEMWAVGLWSVSYCEVDIW